MARLDLILNAHQEVMESLGKFLKSKNKSIVYIIGNHDAEFVFESVRKKFLNAIDSEGRKRLRFIVDNRDEYRPLPGIVVKHGHEYELSHHFDPRESVAVDDNGRKFFIPPWGSYYVTRVVNKFKGERTYANAVRPIKHFIINGLIYDTMFTLRFIVHTWYYFLMVRLMFLMREGNSLKKTLKFALKELELFKDYGELTMDFLNANDDVKALIVGHTHEPAFKTHASGKIFINTGTWTDMYHLDFPRRGHGDYLTYAQINVFKSDKKSTPEELDINLSVWSGTNNLPFKKYPIID